MEILDIKIPDNAKRFQVYSTAFREMEKIPKRYTCEGEDISFPIVIENLPEETKSLLLIVEDPDAPIGIFRHWIAYINKSIKYIPENVKKDRIAKIEEAEIIQGKNDFGKTGYNGPCPPRGHGKHRYYVIILSLGRELNIEGIIFEDFMKNIKEEDIIGYGYTIGIYER
jgi:Raf kinase inhibitor-like YbhB/YbcL family protein